ncbi:MAG TPA: tail fiber domain-containing protein [Alphaproteobacteria bacterium]|nr:tail fiber domain-containing protein [Alphaproteobacteria bacterium]
MNTLWRTLTLAAALLGPSLAYAQQWSDMATISPTTTLVNGAVCYTDGRDIACDSSAGLRTVSGTFTIGSIGVGNLNFSGNISSTSTTGTVSATYGYFKYISATNGLTVNLSETIALNDLSDVSASNPSSSLFIGLNSGNKGGLSNTVIGYQAAGAITTGYQNVAVGVQALSTMTSNWANVAIGNFSLLYSTGVGNTGVGYSAGGRVGSGNYNTFMGYSSTGFGGQSGSRNSGYGSDALVTATNGSDNTGIGYLAAGAVNGGNSNTMVGAYAGRNVSSGNSNTLVGARSASTLTTGARNIVLGADADVPAAATNDWLNIGNAISGSLTGSLTTIGGIKANGVVTATYFEGDGSRLTGISGGSGDRITSGTTSMIANSATTYVSMSTGATVWGYLSSGTSYIPTLTAALVSTTTGGTVSATYGNFRYISATGLNVSGTAYISELIVLGSAGGSGLNPSVGVSPSGATTQIQYNDGGNLAGASGLTYNSGTSVLSTGNINATGQITASAVGATLISATGTTGTVSATYGYFKYISATNGMGSTNLSETISINDLSDASSTVASGNLFLGSGGGGVINGGNTNTGLGIGALASTTTGNGNVASGFQALYRNTTGNANIASGFQALYNNTTGSSNVASGYLALYSNTTGGYNVASGIYTLYSNTTGNYNVASGYNALYSNTTGGYNVASGASALYNNTTGFYNIASGFQALVSNTTGTGNVASGYQALYNNTMGGYNVASGYQALFNNTTGLYNIASGYQALFNNTTGNYNIASGYAALSNNTTGSYNAVYGYNAGLGASGQVVSNSVLVGARAGYAGAGMEGSTFVGTRAGIAVTSGDSNTLVGGNTAATLTTGSYNIVIGDGADVPAATQSSFLNIGNAISGSLTGSLTTIGGIKANGVVTATYFEGDGSRLTGISGGNLSETIAINDLQDASASTVRGNVFLGNAGGNQVTTGTSNTSVGISSLAAVTSGVANSAMGFQALLKNTNGGYNSAYGAYTLFNNGGGTYNTANGVYALYSNVNGTGNTAIGGYALYSNSSGGGNVGIGSNALYNNLSGGNNIAVGGSSMNNNSSGGNNAATGANALYSNTTGSNNAGIGYSALFGNTNGSFNVGVGNSAGSNLTGGNNNIAIGNNAQLFATSASYQLNIANVIYGNTGLTSASLIGINIASPTTALEVSGTVSATRFVGDGSGLTGISGGGSGDRITSGTNSIIAQTASNIISITTNNVNTGYFNANGVLTLPGISATANLTSVTSLYASGNVGIGMAPSASFAAAVSGDIALGTRLRFLNATGNGGGSALIGLYGDGTKRLDIYDYGAGLALMTLKDGGSGGNVGIGTIAPNAKLDVYGTISATGLNITGDISYTGVLTDTSDRRLKTDIKPLPYNSAMERLALLKPVQFRMKDRMDRVEWGFVAQDVEQVFPNLVLTSSGKEGYKSLNYVGMIAPMVQGMQELKKENDDLRKRIEKLEKAVEAQQRK